MDHLRTFTWLMEVKELLVCRNHLWFFAVNLVLMLAPGDPTGNVILYLTYLFLYLVLRQNHFRSSLYSLIIALPLAIFVF
ncbi:hypothetical protein D3C81_305000 [compost metagenome]